MPNKLNTDDALLSALLNEAEPPKSPKQLDDFILNYAKEQAAESTSSLIAFSWNWMNRNWRSTVATLSVAVIAVSVTLQSVTTPVGDGSALPEEIEIALAEADEFRLPDEPVESRLSNISVASTDSNATAVDALQSVSAPTQELRTQPEIAQAIENSDIPADPQPVVLDDSRAPRTLEREARVETAVAEIVQSTAGIGVPDSQPEEELAPADNDRVADSRSSISSDQPQPQSLTQLLDLVENDRIAGPTASNDDLGPDAAILPLPDTNINAGPIVSQALNTTSGAAAADGTIEPAGDQFARRSLASRSSAVQVVNAPAVAANQNAVASADNSTIEEVIVTGAFVQAANATAASAVEVVRPPLRTLVSADRQTQQRVIGLLAQFLLGPSQGDIDLSNNLQRQIEDLIRSFQIRIDSRPEVEARYADMRNNFTDFELPETIEELFEVLATLEFEDIQRGC